MCFCIDVLLSVPGKHQTQEHINTTTNEHKTTLTQQQMNDQAGFYKPYPTLGQAWILFLIFVVMNMGAGLLVPLFPASAFSLGLFLAYCIGMGVTYFIAMRLRGDIPGEPMHRFHLGKVGIYALLLPATWACMLLIVPVVELYPPPDWIEEIMNQFVETTNIWAFLSLVVAAPLFEELIFRGILLDGFLRQYSVRTSILWSAFFFGLYHLNPWQFVTAMAIGIFIGWIYHRTRSLLPCMAIHAFANGTSFFMAANLTEEQVETPLLEAAGGIGPLLLILAGAAVVLYILIRVLDRLLPVPVTEDPLDKEVEHFGRNAGVDEGDDVPEW